MESMPNVYVYTANNPSESILMKCRDHGLKGGTMMIDDGGGMDDDEGCVWRVCELRRQYAGTAV